MGPSRRDQCAECTLHMHVSDCDRPEFRDEIPFKEGRMYDPRNSNFWKKGKIVISVTKLLFQLKIRNLFSRSRLTKQISLLELYREI